MTHRDERVPDDPVAGPSATWGAPRGGSDRRPAGVRPSRARAVSSPRLTPWQEVPLLLAAAVLLAVVVKLLLVQAFYIPSGSMSDTLVLDDRILVEKVSGWGGADPSRGDVVVFADPGGWLGAEPARPGSPLTRGLEAVGLHPTGGHLVKRVIGVGGDHVRCCDAEGRVSVNGTALHEEGYLAPGDRPSEEPFDVAVPEGYLWVMGDHRSQSADSRAHLGDPGGGMVPVEDVVGRVFAVVWPVGHAGVLHRPATFDGVARG